MTPADEPGAGPVPDTGAPGESSSLRPRGRRPPTVTILAGIQLFSAAGYGISLATILTGGFAELNAAMQGNFQNLDTTTVAKAVLVTLFGVLFLTTLAAGVLLLRMRQLGWTITMVSAGFSLSSQIYYYWSGQAVVVLWMTVNVLAVFYLNQRQVREAFGIGQPETTDEQQAGVHV